MAFVEISPKGDFFFDKGVDGLWLDWDKQPAYAAGNFLFNLVHGEFPGVVSLLSGGAPLCVLAKDLSTIPQDILNDPQFEGILFIEKDRVPKADDVQSLFAEIPNDYLPEVEPPPTGEEWVLDNQGYLVLKSRAGRNSQEEHNS